MFSRSTCSQRAAYGARGSGASAARSRSKAGVMAPQSTAAASGDWHADRRRLAVVFRVGAGASAAIAPLPRAAGARAAAALARPLGGLGLDDVLREPG